MFRTVLPGVGLTLLAAACFAAFTGFPALPLALFGAMLVLALLFERYVYQPIRSQPPGAGWERTAEQFADPQTGRSVTVYFNPRTGERRYVADRND